MHHDMHLVGPLHVVRVDQVTEDEFPVAEGLSLQEAADLIKRNQRPNRDVFVVRNNNGDIVSVPLEQEV